MKLKEYLKTADDKRTITLVHQRHGYQVHIAKDTLSEKMRGDLAAMPFHLAKGGYAGDTGNPQDQVVTPDQAKLPVNAPIQEPISPVPTTPPDPTIVAQHEKQQLYNAHLMPSSFASAKGAEDPDLQDKMFGPNGEPPKQPDTNLWNQVDAEYKVQQQNKLDAIKDQQDKAVAENRARMQMGSPSVPVPQIPSDLAQLDQQQQPPAANVPPSGQNYDLQGQGQFSGFNPMMAGTQQMANMYGSAMGNIQQGITGEAKTLGEQGRQQAMAAAANSQAIADLNYQHQQNQFNIQQDMSNTLDDIKAGHINPNNYMENMSTPAKVATAIGLALSGFGSSVTHTQNYAAEYLNNQINRDIDAQKANLGKKETLYSSYLKQYGNERDATDAAMLTQHAIYGNKLQEIAGQSSDPLAKARAQQLLGQQQMQMAPVLQNLAMRKTMMQNMGSMGPEAAIKFLAPEKEQAGLYKDLQDAQNTSRMKDSVLSAFDQVNKLNTPANRLTSPVQSTSQINAIKQPVIAELSKGTAGRFTEADAAFLDSNFPSATDDMQTRAIKRARLNTLVNQKMSFPSLKPYGIDVSKMSRYGNAGQTKFNAQAPVNPKKEPNG